MLPSSTPGGNLHVDPFGLVASADLQSVTAAFGGDLEGDGHFEGDVLALSCLRRAALP